MLISATQTSVFLKMSAVSKILSLKSGSTHAFTWDLNAKVDESRGILLPMRRILLFPKPNEHQRVDFGAQGCISFPAEMCSVRALGLQNGGTGAFKMDLKAKAQAFRTHSEHPEH